MSSPPSKRPSTTTRKLRVIVDDNNYVVIAGNGNPILTSKSYANKASAKRAARRFISAVRNMAITLEYVQDTSRHTGRYVVEHHGVKRHPPVTYATVGVPGRRVVRIDATNVDTEGAFG